MATFPLRVSLALERVVNERIVKGILKITSAFLIPPPMLNGKVFVVDLIKNPREALI